VFESIFVFFSNVFGFINSADLLLCTVLKLCSSAEHVWVPQDQQGRFASYTYVAKFITDFIPRQTPRAQRTSTDAQIWEFSHHKFLRGRPDLLDEIKRKALEPDPTLKHRVELPGEVSIYIFGHVLVFRCVSYRVRVVLLGFFRSTSQM